MKRNLISAPLIGHGNPFAAEAVYRLGQADGIESDIVFQTTVPAIANTVHRFKTSIPALAERYTHDSSSREGFMAKVFGSLSFIELCNRAGAVDNGSTLHLTQEHVLLGTSPKNLARNGFDTARLLIPDVYPKESGKQALLKHIGATAMTWNVLCLGELRADGIAAELVKPVYLDAFRPDMDTFTDGGLPVVVKASGSGMPKAWSKQLIGIMQECELDWAFHSAHSILTPTAHEYSADLTDGAEKFFDNLGGKTEVIIGFPSELVGIAFDVQSRGVPVRMITLPPRGEHEFRNLQTALQFGLVDAELRFDQKAASTSDLQVVRPSNLLDYIHRGLEPSSVDTDFMGADTYWSVVHQKVT